MERDEKKKRKKMDENKNDYVWTEEHFYELQIRYLKERASWM